MDFRAQRYRDRLRAEGRSLAIRTGRRTRDLLDGYVTARRSGAEIAPVTEVLWGRLIVVLAGAATGIYLLVHAALH
jgi:hypothetical protein